MALDINMRYDEERGALIVEPIGELDIFTSADFKKDVVKKLDNYPKADVIMDNKGLKYVDSTGLGVIMFLVKELEDKGGKLVMKNTKKNVEKLLKITQLDQFMEIGNGEE